MTRRSNRALTALAGAGALAIALSAIGPPFEAALGQQSPQSILPPGFGEPTAPPPAPDVTPAAARSAAGAPASASGSPASVAPSDADEVLATDPAQNDTAATQAVAAAELRRQDVPDAARRPTDHIGILPPAVTGIAADGFGAEDGRFLGTLVNRLDAPIASRWLSMLLRRVLTTDLFTPTNVDPADWAAARAALLVRMGEAEAARALVQRVDVDRATPALHAAILDAALASADPAALCPVADAAEQASDAPPWPLARAMCAALAGDGGTAAGLFDRARGLGKMGGVDLQLAGRVIGAGGNARRIADINWAGVDALTPWRFGLASAVGLTIPASLLDDGGLAMQAWRARAPMLPLATRLAAERTAATLGVISAADLVDAYSAAADDGDPNATDKSPAGRLRAAYAAADRTDRVAALRALWADPADERDGYAARILTARAAARVPPADDYRADASALIAAMLSAGLDVQAARWSNLAETLKGDNGEEARALLAVGAPSAVVTLAADAVSGFGSGGRGAARLRAQDLLAALAGLGRLDPRTVDGLAASLAVPLDARNPWTRAIDGAAARGEGATVILLAAVGMQTDDWTQVEPAFLFHIVAALRRTGYEPEARMIAAEALSRT